MSQKFTVSSRTSQREKHKKLTIVALVACLLVVCTGIAGGLYLYFQPGKKVDITGTSIGVKGGEDIQLPDIDPATKELSPERIKQVNDYLGDKKDLFETNNISPTQKIMGIIGANVEVPTSIQSEFGVDSAAIVPTAMKTYEMLWSLFENNGYHTPKPPAQGSNPANVLFSATMDFTSGYLQNTLARHAGVLPGKQVSGCVLSGIGGAGENGNLACTDKKLGSGKWHMQANAPSVAWAGEDDNIGAVAVTFIRTVYAPASEKGKTIIAATPVKITLVPAGSAYNVPWTVNRITTDETTSEVVDGTIAQALSTTTEK